MSGSVMLLLFLLLFGFLGGFPCFVKLLKFRSWTACFLYLWFLQLGKHCFWAVFWSAFGCCGRFRLPPTLVCGRLLICFRDLFDNQCSGAVFRDSYSTLIGVMSFFFVYVMQRATRMGDVDFLFIFFFSRQNALTKT